MHPKLWPEEEVSVTKLTLYNPVVGQKPFNKNVLCDTDN